MDSYYRVKVVDTTSDIYIALEKIANDTVKFWASLVLLSIMCIFYKGIFTMYVALTIQLTSAWAFMTDLFLHAEYSLLQKLHY